ncbi:MAG: hypothetical protein ACTS68_00695 [Candidatus Hodgkinia cicadicola]
MIRDAVPAYATDDAKVVKFAFEGREAECTIDEVINFRTAETNLEGRSTFGRKLLPFESWLAWWRSRSTITPRWANCECPNRTKCNFEKP